MNKLYRLSFDDVIWVFRDLTLEKPDSIFDNPFLSLVRETHEKYGTLIHLNCYYCCPAMGFGDLCSPINGKFVPAFALNEMPDKWLSEWEANADWLTLSFHGFKNFPDAPYVNASYEEALGDCDTVKRELKRFAGRASDGEVTTLHWCSGSLAACRAFRKCGYRYLQAAFHEGKPISYYLPDDIYMERIYNGGSYYDSAEDITFVTSTIVLNSFTPEEIPVKLSNANHDFTEMVMHEQYFYPEYINYLPDYKERIFAGIEWCIENGHIPAPRDAQK